MPVSKAAIRAVLLAAATVGALAGGRLSADQRMIRADEAATWSAVARMNIAGNRSCTATLISPQEAVTSAHCLFNPRTGRQTLPGSIKLVFGFRQESYAALVGVRAVSMLPEYTYSGPKAGLKEIGADLALLALDRAILPAEVLPFAIQDWPATGAELDIVGYGRDRPQIASIREDCGFLGDVGGAMLLDCQVVPGISGAPAVLAGGQVLVGVVSASVGPELAGEQALVVPLAPHLARLRGLMPPAAPQTLDGGG